MKKKILSCLSLIAAVFTSVSVIAFGAKAVKADEVEKITFTTGASIRYAVADDAATGIRFTAKLSKTLYEKLTENGEVKNGVEIGMLIVPETVLSSVQGDYIDYFASKGVAKKEIVTTFDGTKIKAKGDHYIINGAIVTLKDVNYDKTYQAVAYYTENGETFVYSEKSDARSVGFVADAALNDPDSGLKDEARAQVQKINDKYDAIVAANKNPVEIETDIKTLGYTAENTTVSIDLAEKAGGTVAKINGETVESSVINYTQNLKQITYDKSGKVKPNYTYLVETTDGEFKRVNLTLWSLIVDDVDEFLTINSYLCDSDSKYGSGSPLAQTGNIKINADLDFTGKNWNISEHQISYATYTGADSGFRGTFDGFNHTISNLNMDVSNSGIFKVVGMGAVIKNFTATEIQTKFGGVVTCRSIGGSFENIKLTAIKSGYTDSDNGEGYLLGNVGGSGPAVDNYSITVNNCKVLNDKNYALGTYGSPLMIVKDRSGSNYPSVTLNNVVVAGYANICYTYADGSNTIVNASDFGNYKISGKVTHYDTYADYIEATATIAGVETDVKNGLVIADLKEFENKTIVAVNGESNDGATAITYENTDASKDAKVYSVETSDGESYAVKVTVWSLIINSESDLLTMQNYLTYSGTHFVNGYFKLNADLDMSRTNADGKTYKSVYAENPKKYMIISQSGNGNYGGFTGVFDGFNHTINNFGDGGVDYGSQLINNLGAGGEFKNVTFKNYSSKRYNGGLINCVVGGTVENITVEYSSLGYNGNRAAFIGYLINGEGNGNNPIVIKGVTLVNRTTETADNVIAICYGGDLNADASKISITGVKAVGGLTFMASQKSGTAGFDYALDNLDLSGVTYLTLGQYENA